MLTFFTTRHVLLPKQLAKLVPQSRLMTEAEWRKLGVTQSRGWVHYLYHAPGKIFVFALPYLLTTVVN